MEEREIRHSFSWMKLRFDKIKEFYSYKNKADNKGSNLLSLSASFFLPLII